MGLMSPHGDNSISKVTDSGGSPLAPTFKSSKVFALNPGDEILRSYVPGGKSENSNFPASSAFASRTASNERSLRDAREMAAPTLSVITPERRALDWLFTAQGVVNHTVNSKPKMANRLSVILTG